MKFYISKRAKDILYQEPVKVYQAGGAPALAFHALMRLLARMSMKASKLKDPRFLTAMGIGVGVSQASRYIAGLVNGLLKPLFKKVGADVSDALDHTVMITQLSDNLMKSKPPANELVKDLRNYYENKIAPINELAKRIKQGTGIITVHDTSFLQSKIKALDEMTSHVDEDIITAKTIMQYTNDPDAKALLDELKKLKITLNDEITSDLIEARKVILKMKHVEAKIKSKKTPIPG